MTYRVVPIRGRLGEWSPDSSRLVIGSERDYDVVDFVRPETPIRLPDSPLYGGWLSNFQILGRAASGAMIVDIRAPANPLVLDGVSNGGQLSPDGNHLAVTDKRSDLPGTLTSDTTAVFRLNPFGRIAEFNNVAVCCGQPHLWTSDSTAFLALRNRCREGEMLVMVDVEDGGQTVLAQAGTSQAAISPDNRWVAFGAGGLYLVPADGSAQERAVFNLEDGYPGDAGSPEWSPQGRFLAFSVGGFDRCP